MTGMTTQAFIAFGALRDRISKRLGTA